MDDSDDDIINEYLKASFSQQMVKVLWTRYNMKSLTIANRLFEE